MNRTSPPLRRLPGLVPGTVAPVVVIAAVTLVAILAAPFGTGPMPAAERLIFWSLAIAWNAAKWGLWYRFVGPRAGPGWQAQLALALGGAILLNLTLPFEIGLLFDLLGEPYLVSWPTTFASALAISLAISLVFAVAQPHPAPPPPVTVPPAPPALPAAAAPTGLAARAGTDLAAVHAVVAEDHYLRLTLADGRAPLILYRFGDAVRDLAAVDGLQVHRGAWVAAAAVVGGLRQGRRWRLRLAGGGTVPVSASFAAAVRARGWLKG